MKSRDYFLAAIAIGLIFHGTSVFYTFDGTYDAYVHLFFADHYAENWFSNWNEKWYTGFTITSYPPLVHQAIAILSWIIGLKGGFLIWSFFIVALFIRGVYKFSLLWVNSEAAAYAAIAAVFSTAFTEALHLFGQLPSITGVALLLNACPELYKWLRYNKNQNLILGCLTLAVTSTAHHVTTIFGLVFFVFPVLGLAVIDRAQSNLKQGEIQFKDFWKEAISVLPRIIALCFIIIAITIFVIFPYWYWSKSDPITQVPIPHGSRDSYIEVLSSGLVFFLIPWGMMLFFLPYLFAKLFRKRNIFLGLSVTLLFILGTGGTTPIPRMILGSNAFDILTLDRFTYWATILSLPFWGLFLFEITRVFKLDISDRTPSSRIKQTSIILFLGCILASNILIINFSFFRKIQPDKIEIKPIKNFLEVDKHEDWRYMTLGFGDQMAWLSANTEAKSVDGNYHSVRRLPEMTSRAVERLENAKYLGDQGIASLQQFLNSPEKYNLKFIFSNDKFYDPLLYYSGWTKVQRLDNNIIVWERLDVPSLPSILPGKIIPRYQRLMWGIIPISCLLLWVIFFYHFRSKKNENQGYTSILMTESTQSITMRINFIWLLTLAMFIGGCIVLSSFRQYKRSSPENLLHSYFDALDFKDFKEAYTLFDAENRPDEDQYLVQISLESGILSSYAKLDSLDIKFYPGKQENELLASVKANWITALLNYQTHHDFTLIKRGVLWYLIPQAAESRIPPDQLLQMPDIDFYIQGRRKISEKKLLKEDILDRPEVLVKSANLIKRNDQYHVVGELINVDHTPAYIIAEAVLYDQHNQEIVRNSANDVIVHNILPGENTPFRIDFAETLKSLSSLDHKILERIPVKFVLYIQTMIIDTEFYKYTGVQDIQVDSNYTISANFINYGNKEVIIPQILTQWTNSEKLINWVNHKYLPFGIKQQRKKEFSIYTESINQIEIIQKGMTDQFVINGTSMNKSIYSNRLRRFKSNWMKTIGNRLVGIKTNSFTESIYAD